MVRVDPGDDRRRRRRRPRRGADRLVEAHTARGELVDRLRVHVPGAVAAEVVRAQRIGDVDDDVHSAADCSDGPDARRPDLARPDARSDASGPLPPRSRRSRDVEHLRWRPCRGGLPSTRCTSRTRSRSRATRWRRSRSRGSCSRRRAARALTALVVFFNFVPIVLSRRFFGGVVVDRLGFRTTSVVADIASSAAVAAIPLLHTTVGIELWAAHGTRLRRSVARCARSDRTSRAASRTGRGSPGRGWSARAESEAESSRARFSWVHRSVACSWPPSARRTRCGSNAASFLFSAALVVVFVPRPAARDEAKEPKAILRRARGRDAVHLEPARSCVPSYSRSS